MPIKTRIIQAFTLVEVVVALAVFAVAGFGLIGLLASGLHSNQDSKEQLQAATLAEMMCATRRAAPTNSILDSSGNNFVLPPLSASANNLSATTPTYLTWDGQVTTATANPQFGFLYNISTPSSYVPSTAPNNATVYLCIYWPALASPTNPANGHFELTTTFALP